MYMALLFFRRTLHLAHTSVVASVAVLAALMMETVVRVKILALRLRRIHMDLHRGQMLHVMQEADGDFSAGP